MKTFDDLTFVPILNGTGAETNFPNGYGVSVVRHLGSYGGEDGLYELAVLEHEHVCYTTPVTSDVEGWLTPEKVTQLMRQVQELPNA